jgi:hypothetical protein
MYIKRRTCDIRTWKKHLILDISSANIDTHVPSLYQCVDTGSIRAFFLTLISATTALPFQALSHQRNICHFIYEPLYVTNTSQRKQKTFLYEYPLHSVLLPTKTHNRTLLFIIRLLKHGRHFDYWNQPLNMRMSVCYLDSHEAGPCCYLVINIENLLRPSQFLLSFVTYLLTLPRM